MFDFRRQDGYNRKTEKRPLDRLRRNRGQESAYDLGIPFCTCRVSLL